MFGIDSLILGGLSAAGSLLSGLGASSAAKKQAKIQAAYEYQNYMLQESINAQNKAQGQQIVTMYDPATRVVGDAAKAGFNPVTWLNAMGGMYASMTQYGWALQKPEPYFQNAPTAQVPSVMSAIGGAISAGASTLNSAHQNAMRVDAANQSSMLQYLASVQRARSEGNALAGLGTPSFSSAVGRVITGGGAAAALSLGASLRAPKVNDWGVEVKAPQASTPSFMGPGDQSISGAQTAQDAYDWPLSIPFGAAKFGADAYRRMTGRQFMGDFWADWSDVFPSRMSTERGQAAADERSSTAYGTGVPFFLRNVPGIRDYFGTGQPGVPFYENPNVFQ